MRIATFNILHGRSIEDGRVDVDRLAAAVKSLDADVLGLQEVDHDQPRSHGTDLTAVAAGAMRAVDSRFVAALSGTPGGTWTAIGDGDQPRGASYGVSLLSRHPVVSWQVVRMAALPVSVPLWVPGARRPFLVRDEPRVAVAAVVDGPWGRFTACTTHLSFIPRWNSHQLRTLVRSLEGSPGPLVLLGDLNMQQRAASRHSGLTPLATAATFPAPRPSRQLDHVLARGGLRAIGPAEAVRLPLSDHRALAVRVAAA